MIRRLFRRTVLADNHATRGPVDALNAYGWETVCLDGYQMELVGAFRRDLLGKQSLSHRPFGSTRKWKTHSREGAAETLENNRNALEAYNRVSGEYRDAVAELSRLPTLSRNETPILPCAAKRL